MVTQAGTLATPTRTSPYVVLVVLPGGLPLTLWREVPLTGPTAGMVGGGGMAVTVLLGAQLLAVLYQSFSDRNHTYYSLCPYYCHHQLSPLAYKDVNQPRRINLIVSQLHVLSPIRLEEVWISSTVDDRSRD